MHTVTLGYRYASSTLAFESEVAAGIRWPEELTAGHSDTLVRKVAIRRAP